MCVILDIPANRSIPLDKLTQACDINADGYGIAWVDKGCVQVKRSIKKNDPKEIAEFLDKIRRFHRVVHLRYSTVGAVSMENNHPFVVLENNKGPQVVLFHNGTLGQYKEHNSPKSDTFFFSENFVRPLVKRIEAFSGLKKTFEDGFFQMLLRREVGLSSVIVLFDRFGNVLRINESRGKQFETFWASNDYSFDPNHWRSSSIPSSSLDAWRGSTHLHSRHHSGVLPWEEVKSDLDLQVAVWGVDRREREPIVAVPNSAVQTEIDKRQEFKRFYHRVQYLKVNRQGSNMVVSDKALAVRRQSFAEQAGLKDISEIGHLTEKDLVEMCPLYPNAMAQLIIELGAELRKTSSKLAIKERELAKHTSENK